MFDLSGKKALVTGASGGIGGAIARALHRQGAHLALSGTKVAALEALAGECTPVSERDGVVTVACRSAVWSQELSMMAGDLADRLQPHLPI